VRIMTSGAVVEKCRLRMPLQFDVISGSGYGMYTHTHTHTHTHTPTLDIHVYNRIK